MSFTQYRNNNIDKHYAQYYHWNWFAFIEDYYSAKFVHNVTCYMETDIEAPYYLWNSNIMSVLHMRHDQTWMWPDHLGQFI